MLLYQSFCYHDNALFFDHLDEFIFKSSNYKTMMIGDAIVTLIIFNKFFLVSQDEIYTSWFLD